MASKPHASKYAERFSKKLRGLERARAKLERLHVNGSLSRADVLMIYGSIYLVAVTHFEGFLEDLFFSLVMGSVHCPGVHRRAEFISHLVAKDIIFKDGYLKWLPYDETIKRAHIYFRSGIPFTNLDNNDQLILRQMSCTRNAIAHRSEHAIEKFEKQVLSGISLLPIERTPTGFLRSYVAAGQTRYEHMAGELHEIAWKIVGK